MKPFKNFKAYPTRKDGLMLLKILFVLYFFVLFLLIVFQRNFMYFPSKDISISTDWLPLQKNGRTIALKEKNSQASYNILIFHGNAGNANMRNNYRLLFPNANIIVAEYPGFGFRSHEKINKDNIITASAEIVEEVMKDGKRLILVGESLGSGVASEMAMKYDIKDLVLITPYDNISSVAQSMFSFLPIYPLIFDRYNNSDTLKKFNGNVVLLIAEFDQVIPTKFAYALYESLGTDVHKSEILIKDSGHNNYTTSFSEENRKSLHKFLQIPYY